MENKLQQDLINKPFTFFLSLIGFVLVVTGLLAINKIHTGKIFPNTYIDSIEVSQKTVGESVEVLESIEIPLPPHTLLVTAGEYSISSSSAELKHSFDYVAVSQQAYESPRTQNPITTAANLTQSYFSTTKLTAPTQYDKKSLDNLLKTLAEKVFVEGKNPEIRLKTSDNEESLEVFTGIAGKELNIGATKEKILAELNNQNNLNQKMSDDSWELVVEANIETTNIVLDNSGVKSALDRAKDLVGKKLIAEADERKYEIDDIRLVSLINPLGGYYQDQIQEIIIDWAKEINRPASNAEFEYDPNTLKVTTFSPHRDGLALDEARTQQAIIAWLDKATENSQDESQNLLQLPLKRDFPEITLEQTNDLGINERIGFGESYFRGSIPNRVHNVGITADRISLLIIPPGKEFSFNRALGEVSARTGFRSAYIISGGRTVLGDGGGVCQVSSTLFRSVMDAGLKITRRLQHSYRVSYYELNADPGFDATVYAGDVDFRFVNDTGNHIMLYSTTDLDNNYMNIEIYGTDDGRTSEIVDYKKWDLRSPPAPEYYPTDTLPSGVTRQIDWSVSGIKTEFTYLVKDKDGKVLHENIYYSNFRPWSAKFLVGN
jgi:vancomycin resistance protein YoaR